MNAKLCKVIIFAAGAAVGAVISALVTKKVVTSVCWDECDREMNEQSLRHGDEMRALNEENKQLKEKIAQQNVAIQVLSDKVAGIEPEKEVAEASDDKEDDRSEAETEKNEAEKGDGESVRRKYWHSDSEELEEITEEEAEADVWTKKERGAYPINEADFDTSCLDYMKEDLRYYLYDGKMLNEDGEWLDNYANFVGCGWENEPRNNGDYIFVRNDYFATDYKITFLADFGEGHITVSDSEWED